MLKGRQEEGLQTSFPFKASLSSLLNLDSNPEAKAKTLKTISSEDSWDLGQKARKGKSWKGKQTVIDGINELIDELENIPTQITQEGLDLVHSNEALLHFKLLLKTGVLGRTHLWLL